MILLAGAVVVAVILVTASATEETLTGDDIAKRLSDRSFLSVPGTGFGAEQNIAGGHRLTLEFQGDRISAHAGCNTMSGSFSIEGDVLHVPLLAQTMKACPGPLMMQDRWVSTLLTSEPTIALSGHHLRITGTDGMVDLQDRSVADPDRSLTGTTWSLDGIGTDGAVSTVPSGVVSTLEIGPDGAIRVDTGCNRGTGTVSITERDITVGPLALTRMACPSPADQVEQAVMSTLQGQVGYTISGDSLTLARDGETALVYRAMDSNEPS